MTRNPSFSFVLFCAVALAAGPACSLVVSEDHPPCGNGIVEGHEECDRDDFGFKACQDYDPAFTGGHLACNPLCRVETFNCHKYACGDGRCDPEESPEWCPEDCGDRIAVCGDGFCDPSETHMFTMNPCMQDCDGVTCGNGFCQPPGEHSSTCPEDCDGAFYCGDGVCQDALETWGYNQCHEDCDSPGPQCGDHFCDEGETGESCPDDCRGGPCNGNLICEPDEGEDPGGCADCHFCVDNGVCHPADEITETSGICPDCHGLSCGDAVCDTGLGEDAQSCPDDCGGVCGNGTAEGAEQCDGEDLREASCNVLANRTEEYTFDDGELACHGACIFDTALCKPRDLGNGCDVLSDCRSVTGIECWQPVGGTGVCTYQCGTQADCTSVDPATECVDVSQASLGTGTFCLLKCSGGVICGPGLTCTGFGSGEYCAPPP